MPNVLQLSFTFTFLDDCFLSFLLERNELLGEGYLLLRHLIFKLADLIFKVRLEGFTDVLDDSRLVDLRLNW